MSVAFEVTTAVGTGRFAAGIVVAVVGGKVTSAFPDKSIQKLFALVREARRARPRSLVRYAILGEFFGWQAGAGGAGSSQDKEGPIV